MRNSLLTQELTKYSLIEANIWYRAVQCHDVIILICLKKAGITRLATHDQAFRQIKDIEVINPVVLDI